MSPWNRGVERAPVIPKKTSPLTKSIRTGEMILTIVANVVIALYSAIRPGVLHPTTAATIIGSTTGGITLQRTILKGLAILKGVEPSVGTIVNVATHDLEPALDHISPSFADTVKKDIDRLLDKAGGATSIENAAKSVEDAFQEIGEPAIGPDPEPEPVVSQSPPTADPPVDPGLLVEPAPGAFASDGADAPQPAAASTIL